MIIIPSMIISNNDSNDNNQFNSISIISKIMRKINLMAMDTKFNHDNENDNNYYFDLLD